jgi:hypothetical protein
MMQQETSIKGKIESIHGEIYGLYWVIDCNVFGQLNVIQDYWCQKMFLQQHDFCQVMSPEFFMSIYASYL